MSLLRIGKKRLFLLFILCIFITGGLYAWSILSLPGEIILMEGDEFAYSLKSPFFSNIHIDKEGIVNLKNTDAKVFNFLRFSNPMSLKPQKNGSVNLKLKLLGLIPLRTLKVDVVPSREIAACGSTVGVKLQLDGILVIAMSDVETVEGKRTLPASGTGIKPGDLITGVNGRKLDGIDELVEEIGNSKGNPIRLQYRSGDIVRDVTVKPEKAADDKKYHIGLWVRDSTAGIGTLTFYDPVSKSFGALGHGITDIDTGTLMPIRKGEILESNILGIKKGRAGIPGELKGVFIEDRNQLGTISVNSILGIYGVLDSGSVERIPSRLYPVGLRFQVEEGPAAILSNIDGKTVEKFQVDIQKVSRNNLNGTKGMIIKITDERLLDRTGGIVQGMSGSPIIQNNRIVGAVTHVLVNDPTRGYGIFIEGMIRNLPDIDVSHLEKAG